MLILVSSELIELQLAIFLIRLPMTNAVNNPVRPWSCSCLADAESIGRPRYVMHLSSPIMVRFCSHARDLDEAQALARAG
jgi:hypothetical protein